MTFRIPDLPEREADALPIRPPPTGFHVCYHIQIINQENTIYKKVSDRCGAPGAVVELVEQVEHWSRVREIMRSNPD